MGTNMAQAGTSPASTTTAVQAAFAKDYTDGEVRQLVVALEEPFDPREIKWRVTNTTADKRRGQMLAYADPRAYTDRLNALFTVRGWTRRYAVETINNVERKLSNGTQIAGKVVVTCEVTIHGLGTHSGIGEEWADNENAGTAAEAQAFKRACSCFGLGRYLYDLDGTWVDLDERKQPKSSPRLPDWALPKHKAANSPGRKPASQEGRPAGQNSASSQDSGTLRLRLKALSDQVGFSLSQSVLMASAKVNAPEKVGASVIADVVRKLEDTARGVERLRAAIAAVGPARYEQVSRELNFPSYNVDDIPDRDALRKVLGILEPEAAACKERKAEHAPAANGTSAAPADQTSNAPTAKQLDETRYALLTEALRVAALRKMKVGEVVNRAAKGAFTYDQLRQLTVGQIDAIKAATDVLRKVAS